MWRASLIPPAERRREGGDGRGWTLGGVAARSSLAGRLRPKRYFTPGGPAADTSHLPWRLAAVRHVAGQDPSPGGPGRGGGGAQR